MPIIRLSAIHTVCQSNNVNSVRNSHDLHFTVHRAKLTVILLATGPDGTQVANFKNTIFSEETFLRLEFLTWACRWLQNEDTAWFQRDFSRTAVYGVAFAPLVPISQLHTTASLFCEKCTPCSVLSVPKRTEASLSVEMRHRFWS